MNAPAHMMKRARPDVLEAPLTTLLDGLARSLPDEETGILRGGEPGPGARSCELMKPDWPHIMPSYAVLPEWIYVTAMGWHRANTIMQTQSPNVRREKALGSGALIPHRMHTQFHKNF